MTRNEAKYPNPEQFRPERFFSANGQLNGDIVCYAFGAGRRICAGRHIADASLWSAIVSMLAIFRITPCKDEQGNDIPVNPQWTAGITSCVHFTRLLYSVFIRSLTFVLSRHPLRFPCQFVPRAPGGLTAEKLAQIF